MNKLKILTLTTLLALVLTGCGMNAEKLADEMIAAMEGKQLTQATATMTMEMSMEAEGLMIANQTSFNPDMEMVHM